MYFLKNLLASLIGLFLFSLIVIFGILLIVFFSQKDIEVKENSVLKISIKQNLVDRVNSSEFNLTNSNPNFNGLFSIQKAIESASKDPLIKAIYLEIGELKGGVANVSSLKRSIEKVKKSGKSVITYSDGLSQIGYYLACSSDTIFINHLSFVEWKGLGAKLLYFKSMLNKIGIQAEPVRVGKFKSAIEPFISDSISPENFHQVKEMLTDIWSTLLQDVSLKRGTKNEELDEIANEYGYLMPDEALKFGLIDGVKYEDEVFNVVEYLVGDKPSYISVEKYNKSNEHAFEVFKKVVVVNAEGEIIDANSETDVSGIKYGKILDDVLKDQSVEALVLRINSPGGSALASEKLWRKLKLIQQKIPVIVSMGNVAASGGYYLASAGDVILAEKNTITGSIGVFGLMFNVAELNNSIGLNVENIKTNDFSDFPAFDRGLNNKEKERMKEGVKAIYKTFIERVQDGRGMSREDVEGLAQGRVWSGVQAKRLGLVDSIGGLGDAISIAVEKANLDKYKIVHLPKELSPVEAIVNRLSSKNEVSLPAPFKQYNYMIKNPDFFKAFSRPQARLPFIMEIN